MDSQQLATEPAEKKKRVLSPELYPLAAHKTTDPVMEEEITQSIASMGTLTQVTQVVASRVLTTLKTHG